MKQRYDYVTVLKCMSGPVFCDFPGCPNMAIYLFQPSPTVGLSGEQNRGPARVRCSIHSPQREDLLAARYGMPDGPFVIDLDERSKTQWLPTY